MSMIACIIPYTNGSYKDGNIVRVYPWRTVTRTINKVEVVVTQIQVGGGEAGWVDASEVIPSDLTFKMFLFVEVEDSVGEDLYSYTGRQRGRFVWRSKFTSPAFRTKLLDITQHVPVQMGKGVNKSDIVKGPDWGKPRGRPT